MPPGVVGDVGSKCWDSEYMARTVAKRGSRSGWNRCTCGDSDSSAGPVALVTSVTSAISLVLLVLVVLVTWDTSAALEASGDSGTCTAGVGVSTAGEGLGTGSGSRGWQVEWSESEQVGGKAAGLSSPTPGSEHSAVGVSGAVTDDEEEEDEEVSVRVWGSCAGLFTGVTVDSVCAVCVVAWVA